MINCIQIPDGDSFICTQCGWKYHKRVRRNCPKYRPLLGDRIAKLTRRLGIKPCGGCKKRQKWLNRIHAAIRRKLKGNRNGH